MQGGQTRLHRASGKTLQESDTMTDTELAERFRDGDEEAVRTVYRRHSRAVMTVAMSVLGDRDLAAEAVQQTFLNAWKAAGTFDPEREIAPWLYAIARRAAIDVYRKESRPTQSAHDEEVEVAVSSPGIEQTWEAWEVRSAIDKLSVEEREVVRLSHGEGWAHPEIGGRLGVPVGTVKSRSHRAHQRLARLLRHVVEVAP